VATPARAQPAAQIALPRGAIVGLHGTPHLWIADERGVVHWAGDTRALAGRVADWGTRADLTLQQLRTLPLGDPWLSAGLLKDGDPIYLVKWEADWPAPRLQRVQSLADLELFGIDGANYADLVLDRLAWEAQHGIAASELAREELAPAVVRPGSLPPSPPRGPAWYAPAAFAGEDQTYLWVPAWQEQVQDTRLLWGLILAGTHNAAWRDQIGVPLAVRQTTIRWSDLPYDINGATTPGRNTMRLNRLLQRETLGVLAAVLAHEAYHAVAPVAPGEAACLAAEVAAYGWEGATWAAMPAHWRSTSGRGLWEQTLARAWQNNDLAQFVHGNAGYRQQCAAVAQPG
jgi:hypothetical protein